MPLGFPVHSGGQHLVSYSQKYLPCCLLLWISFTTLFTSLRAQTLSTPVSELEIHLLSVYGLSRLRIRFWFHSFLCCHSSIQDMVNQDVAIWSDSPNVVFFCQLVAQLVCTMGATTKFPHNSKLSWFPVAAWRCVCIHYLKYQRKYKQMPAHH